MKKFFEVSDPPPSNAGLFGLNCKAEEAKVVVLGVPWDATSSYHRGSAAAPRMICQASHQLDLYDFDYGASYRQGICLEEFRLPLPRGSDQASVNTASRQINSLVFQRSTQLLDSSKVVGVLGGDHSVPYGLIQALNKKVGALGILQIDAHHDLRESYLGFEFSHASIMYNALRDFEVKSLVAVGIRDYSEDEAKLATSDSRIKSFYAEKMFRDLASGKKLGDLYLEIVDSLPENVYVSLDVDGLDQTSCPGTGTPVPGGISFLELSLLLKVLVDSGKRIVGFDLCEVCPTKFDRQWNANVGARILYKLCGASLASEKQK